MVLYDGAWGAIYGLLACTKIPTFYSGIVGAIGGFVSSIGSNLLFNEGQIKVGEAFLNMGFGFLA